MSRLSAVVFPDVRVAIVIGGLIVCVGECERPRSGGTKLYQMGQVTCVGHFGGRVGSFRSGWRNRESRTDTKV